MANVKIKPIGDRVLVEHIEEKEQVRGGIIIPDSAKEKPQEAKVIALGTGKKGEDGKVTTWGFEMGSPNGFMRAGWTRNSMKVGDLVTVEASRAKDGSNNANAKTVTLVNTGQTLFAASSQPEAGR